VMPPSCSPIFGILFLVLVGSSVASGAEDHSDGVASLHGDEDVHSVGAASEGHNHLFDAAVQHNSERFWREAKAQVSRWENSPRVISLRASQNIRTDAKGRKKSGAKRTKVARHKDSVRKKNFIRGFLRALKDKKGIPRAGKKQDDRVELLELSEQNASAEDSSASAPEESNSGAAPTDTAEDSAASSTDTTSAAEPSDTLDPQSTKPTEVSASSSVEDQMKAFESHQRDRLSRASEDNVRMSTIKDKISGRLEGKKVAMKTAEDSVNSFTDQLALDGPRVESELVASTAEASTATEAARKAAQKVLEFSQQEDKLDGGEAKSYEQGLEMAKQFRMDDEAKSFDVAAHREKLEQSEQEVSARLSRIRNGDSAAAAKEERSIHSAQAHAAATVNAVANGGDISAAKDQMENALNKQHTEDQSQQQQLSAKLEQLHGALAKAGAVRQQNSEMKLKLKAMEEKLNTQVLAHKLGLEMPRNPEQPDSADKLKSEVVQTKLRIGQKRGEMSATQAEITTMQARLAQAAAEGSNEAYDSEAEAADASNGSNEMEEQVQQQSQGADLTPSELKDFDYGEKIAEGEMVENDPSQAGAEPDDDDDDDMDLGESQRDTSKQEPETEEEDNSAEQAKIDEEITQEKTAALKMQTKATKKQAAVDAKMDALEAENRQTQQAAAAELSGQAARMESHADQAENLMLNTDPASHQKQLEGLAGKLRQMKAALSKTAAASNIDGMATVADSVIANEQAAKQETQLANDNAQASAAHDTQQTESLKTRLAEKQEQLAERGDRLSSENSRSALKNQMNEEVSQEKAEMKLQASKSSLEKAMQAKLAGERKQELREERSLRDEQDGKKSQLAGMKDRLQGLKGEASSQKEQEKLKLKEVEKTAAANKAMEMEAEQSENAKAGALGKQLENQATKKLREQGKVAALKGGLKDLSRTESTVAAEVTRKAAAIDTMTRANAGETDKLRDAQQQTKSLTADLDKEQAELDKLKTDISFDENSISSTSGDSPKVDLMRTELASVQGGTTALEQESAAAQKAADTEMSLAKGRVQAAQSRVDAERKEARKSEDASAQAVREAKEAAEADIAKDRRDEKEKETAMKALLTAEKEKAKDHEQATKEAAERQMNRLRAESEENEKLAARQERDQSKKTQAEMEALEDSTRRKEEKMRAAAKEAEQNAKDEARKVAAAEQEMEIELQLKKDELAAQSEASMAEARADDAKEEAKLKSAADSQVAKARTAQKTAEDAKDKLATRMEANEDRVEREAEQLAAGEVAKMEKQLNAKEQATIGEMNKSKQAELKAAMAREEQAKKKLDGEAGVEDEAVKAMRELKKQEKKANQDLASSIAVEQAKLDDSLADIPHLKLALKELSPQVDRATKRTAEAQNKVARLQRMNQMTKTEVVTMEAKKDMLDKKLKIAEQKYVTKASKLKKMTKTTDKYEAESDRLKRKIEVLEESSSKVKNEALAEQQEKAALAKKMKSVESALSPEQLAAKEKKAEEKMKELKKDQSDKEAEASNAKEELQPGWGLVHV